MSRPDIKKDFTYVVRNVIHFTSPPPLFQRCLGELARYKVAARRERRLEAEREGHVRRAPNAHEARARAAQVDTGRNPQVEPGTCFRIAVMCSKMDSSRGEEQVPVLYIAANARGEGLRRHPQVGARPKWERAPSGSATQVKARKSSPFPDAEPT